jgi:tRNA (guanine37-N1)-methyltransferase
LESEASVSGISCSVVSVDERSDYRDERKIVLVNRLPSTATTTSILPFSTDSANHDAIIIKALSILKQTAESEAIGADASSKILQCISSIRSTTMELSTTYEDYTVDEALSQLLPLPYVSSISTAFESVGHLAHLNLPSHLLPFKYIIAKVIADKNQPAVQIVVNKISTIHNEFRTFPMEILWKATTAKRNISDDHSSLFEVQVKQGGCTFQLNFAQVYWNSRLQFEHERLVQYILSMSHLQEETSPLVIADVMAGVGPFSVPLSLSTISSNKKNCNYHNIQVHANDLNPASYQYLQVNLENNHKRNKTAEMANSNYHCYNLDGRTFLHHLLWERKIHLNHCIMNLPAIAIEFLDAFRGYSSPLPPTVVHVYCFETKREEDAKANAIKRCETALGCSIEAVLNIHIVRDVSPHTNMMCISFLLPYAIVHVPRIRTNTEVVNDNTSSLATTSANIRNASPINDNLQEAGNYIQNWSEKSEKDPKRAKVDSNH